MFQEGLEKVKDIVLTMKKWKWKSSDSLWPHRLYSPWNSPGRILEWIGFPFSRGSSQPRDRTQVSHIAGRFFTSWATKEAHLQISRQDESQAAIKIARKNINSLRCADDTTLMAESEEELKSLLLRVKGESEKAGLKVNIQKKKRNKETKIMVYSPITSWQIDGKTIETVTDFIFLGSKITADSHCSHEIKRCLLLGKKAMKT